MERRTAPSGGHGVETETNALDGVDMVLAPVHTGNCGVAVKSGHPGRTMDMNSVEPWRDADRQLDVGG